MEEYLTTIEKLYVGELQLLRRSNNRRRVEPDRDDRGPLWILTPNASNEEAVGSPFGELRRDFACKIREIVPYVGATTVDRLEERALVVSKPRYLPDLCVCIPEALLHLLSRSSLLSTGTFGLRFMLQIR